MNKLSMRAQKAQDSQINKLDTQILQIIKESYILRTNVESHNVCIVGYDKDKLTSIVKNTYVIQIYINHILNNIAVNTTLSNMILQELLQAGNLNDYSLIQTAYYDDRLETLIIMKDR